MMSLRKRVADLERRILILAITRVVMLMVGGLICFGISVLYNRLENSLKE